MKHPAIGKAYKASYCQLAPPDRKEYSRGYLVSAMGKDESLENGNKVSKDLYCCMCGKTVVFAGASYVCNYDSELLDVTYIITHQECVEDMRDFLQNNSALLQEWFLSIPEEVIIMSAKKRMQ